jgi:hypothetical protein
MRKNISRRRFPISNSQAPFASDTSPADTIGELLGAFGVCEAALRIRNKMSLNGSQFLNSPSVQSACAIQPEKREPWKIQSMRIRIPAFSSFGSTPSPLIQQPCPALMKITVAGVISPIIIPRPKQNPSFISPPNCLIEVDSLQ